jgi:hypothetical protein
MKSSSVAWSTALLNLCNDETGANGVNGSCWNGDHVVGRNSPPSDKIYDRAIVHGRPQLLRCHLLLQSQGNLGVRSSA